MDFAKFEAATIRDGMQVDVILRRRGPAILEHLTPAERHAVEAYGATFEAVAAGGATLPRDTLAGGGGGGAPAGPSREGRQSQVVDQAAFLRRMAAPIQAQGVLVFGRRRPVEVGALTFWHGFIVNGWTVAEFNRRHGRGRGGKATAEVVDTFRRQAALVAAAMAEGRNPLA